MAVLRSLLFVPGNRPNMLEKAMGTSPDAYIPDMEDSVPAEEKENARNVTASFLPKLAEVGPLVIPRINSLDTGLLQDDLAAVVGPHIFGISVGKIESSKDIDQISNIIEGLEKKAGRPCSTATPGFSPRVTTSSSRRPEQKPSESCRLRPLKLASSIVPRRAQRTSSPAFSHRWATPTSWSRRSETSSRESRVEIRELGIHTRACG